MKIKREEILQLKKSSDKILTAGVYSTESNLQRARAIRLFCLNCCGGQRKEVILCQANDCPLHRFRLSSSKMRFWQNEYEKVLREEVDTVAQ